MRRLALIAALAATEALADPSGRKWFGLPSDYQVYSHGSINGVSNFSGAVLPAVQNAFLGWTKTKLSCTKWDIQYLGQFSSPSGTAAINGNDNQNLVIWLGGASWRYTNSTLALTTTTYWPGSGEIFDADLEVNNNVTWSSSGAAYTYDYESVLLHEAGHFLGLAHTAGSVAVMSASIAYGEIKRALQSPDISDVCGVYPGNGVPGSQGSSCLQSSNCVSGLVCRKPPGLPAGASGICTVDCSAGQTCPAGYTCQTADTGKACLVPVGSPDLCQFCTDGSGCSTGKCVTDGRHLWCSVTCTSSASCGTGYDCVSTPSGGVCVPQGSCGNQCTTGAQCAPGFGCVSGTCEATGQVGDRCEIAAYCGACSSCIGTRAEAYCRACCGGQGAGGQCTSCNPTSCTSGFTCKTLVNSSDKVCDPASGASTCQACDAQTPCAQGLSCVGGRCHAACSPTNPGSCQACYELGGGGGLCACPDETAYAGQSCGAKAGGGFSACVQGTMCVGQPSICRKPCVVGQGGCAASESCQAVSGETVCVPSNTPGTRCSPCNSTTPLCGNGLSCFHGRCYEPCNPTAPLCDSCVQVEVGLGLCACDDQRSGVQQYCGLVPPGDLYACQKGLVCAAQQCRLECSSTNPGICPVGTTCQAWSNSTYCLPPPPYDAGTGGGGGMGGGAGGGAGGGTGGGGGRSDAPGCGCSEGAAAGWPLLMTIWLGVRRRRARPHPRGRA